MNCYSTIQHSNLRGIWQNVTFTNLVTIIRTFRSAKFHAFMKYMPTIDFTLRVFGYAITMQATVIKHPDIYRITALNGRDNHNAHKPKLPCERYLLKISACIRHDVLTSYSVILASRGQQSLHPVTLSHKHLINSAKIFIVLAPLVS